MMTLKKAGGSDFYKGIRHRARCVFNKRRLPLSVGLCVAAMASASAHAQLEEVLVTAQKRVQSVQDVGLTVSAYSAGRLDEAGVSDVVDVAGLSPNVEVNYGLGNNFFNIRGLGLNEFVANLDAPVAVHVDEIYQSKGFLTGMTLFDIERVEVLKGPQGDLFGRNTTGGAVNFFTRKPEEELGGYVRVNYGNYDTVNIEGAITGPISENLSGRLSGYLTDQGEGYYKNTTRNTDEGRVDEKGLRGQLLWRLDDTEVLLSLHYGKDDSELHPYEGVGIKQGGSFVLPSDFCPEYLNGSAAGNTPGCNVGLDVDSYVADNGSDNIPAFQPGENDPYVTQNNLSFKVDNESWGGLVRVDKNIDDAVLTSTTGYERFDQNQREDSDGSPNPNSVQVYWYTEFEQFTQEFRISSDFDHDNWNYIVGFFYEHDELYNGDYLTAYEFTQRGNVLFGDAFNNYSSYDQTVDALAVFAHVEYHLTDTLRLVNGVRFSWEETELDGGTFAGTGITGLGGEERPAVITRMRSDAEFAEGGNTRRDEDVSFKFGLNWSPTDDALVYGSITTGFRSGGYSIAFANEQDELTNLEPEEIISYEIGMKTTWADNTFQLNGAAFRYDFRNAHIDIDGPAVVPITVNAGEVEIVGFELEAHWTPVNGLDLIAGLGWTDSEIESELQIDTGAGPTDLAGNRTAFNPEWSFSGQVRYEIPVTDSLSLVLSSDFSWRDDTYLEANNQPSNLREAYWLVNGRVALRTDDGNWKLALWGKNLTDEAYQVYLNDLPAFGWLLNGYAAPRTYGLTLNYTF